MAREAPARVKKTMLARGRQVSNISWNSSRWVVMLVHSTLASTHESRGSMSMIDPVFSRMTPAKKKVRKPYRTISPLLTRTGTFAAIVSSRDFPTVMPTRQETISFPTGMRTEAKERKSLPAIMWTISTLMENKTIRTTSMATLTLRAIVVNGPDARISFTTAMAEAGDRAIRTVLASKHTASLSSLNIPLTLVKVSMVTNRRLKVAVISPRRV
mmetsp:Transcript_144571/g.252034  ORF Transcript_144571/g.252034 Transcript_144571/m.252034 type:complete len:214 (+) Transcript_144571:398-1039(+)